MATQALPTPDLSQEPRLSPSLNRIAIVTAVLMMLTSSFDIFLALQAGGTYRFCQAIAPLLIALAAIRSLRGVKMPVLGALPLLIWLLFLILFIPNASFWPKSVAYCFWLLVNVLVVFAFVHLFSDNLPSLITILRWYVWSFGLVAMFGIVQFLLPLTGLVAPLIMEWWLPGQLARANGFSYEPSYFATYLLIGFVFVASLRRSRSPLLPGRSLLVIYWATLLGIIVSSSRMGIIFLLADIALAQSARWLSVLKDAGRLCFVRKKLWALVPSLLSMALLAALAVGALNALENNPAVMLMFLNGTGLSDTAAHSVVERESAFADTLQVFLDHPLAGRSLGGVSSSIADLHGQEIQSFGDLKQFEGMNVFAEVLAASGVIGVIPFVVFLVVTIRKPIRLARVMEPSYAGLLHGLVRSLFFAWAILQFNQNLLRPYLWVHLAILASVYATGLQACKARLVRNST